MHNPQAYVPALNVATSDEDVDRDSWRTPLWFFDEVRRRFARNGIFDLDAAADDENALCSTYYTKKDNALIQPWTGCVYVNPPYSFIEPWVHKAHAVVFQRIAERVVMVLPSRTGTDWYGYAERYGRVYRVQGRLNFDTPPGAKRSSNPQDTIIVVFERPFDVRASGGIRP